MLKTDDFITKIKFFGFVFGLMGLLLMAFIADFFSNKNIFATEKATK